MRIWLRVSAVAACLSMVLPQPTAVQCASKTADGTDDRTLAELRAMAEAYLHNRESFPFFTCSFVVSSGGARNEEEARLRGPTGAVTRRSGIWVVDGDKVRYELLPVGRLKIEGAGGDGAFSVTLPPEIYLANGPAGLKADLVMNGGILYSRDKVPSRPPSLTPWDFADLHGTGEDYTFGRLIAEYSGRPDVYQFSLRGPEELRGKRVVRVDVHSGDVFNVFFLDPKRAYLPVEIWCPVKGQPDIKVFVTHVRACSNARWFPERCVVVWLPPREYKDAGVTVRELRVTELDVDRPPAEEAFAVTTPHRLQLHDGSNPNSGIQIQAGRTIHVRDLPSLVRGQELQTQAHGGASVPEDSRLPFWVIIGLNVIVVTALMAVWYGHRRARRGHRPPDPARSKPEGSD